MKHRVQSCLFATCVAAVGGLPAQIPAANWSIARTNHMVVSPPGGVSVAEMSGVTYLGPSASGHRFIAAEEAKEELLAFDLAINAAGAITGISNVTAIPITFSRDFEGIAYTNPTRNSVFLADETTANGPCVRELSLMTSGQFQIVTIPMVFTANKRTNLGFESLARSPDGTVMWTANEQALIVDGSTSTATDGTAVRLLELDVNGNVVTAGPQFAYEVEPIHGTSTFGSPQSGLCDLVAMPDGRLLALERSVVVGTPIYLSRIFEIDFAGATDVSIGVLGNGLAGQDYIAVGKELLFAGAADAASGQNLEGLTLGPQLANGNWVLIGVVDNNNGTDPLSINTIVAFTATAIFAVTSTMTALSMRPTTSSGARTTARQKATTRGGPTSVKQRLVA